MLKPVAMQKVRLLLPRASVASLVARLHELGVMEIVTSEHDGLEKGKPLDNYDEVAEQLIRMRVIRQVLGEFGKNKKPSQIEAKEAIREASALRIDGEIEELNARKDGLTAEKNMLRDQQQVIQLLEKFANIDFSKLQTKSLNYWVGKTNKKMLAQLAGQLDGSEVHCSLLHKAINEQEELVLVVYRRSEKTDELLAQSGIQKIDVPAIATIPSHNRQNINQRLEGIENELRDIRHAMEKLAGKYYDKVASLENSLQREADRAEIASRFGFTTRTAWIEGWIRRDHVGILEQETKKFDDGIILQVLDDEHEMPPTILDNPKQASSIQFITEMFSLPNAREIDPSMIYLITLPLLYGMIVGDVIYGIISFFIASWIIKKFYNSRILYNVGHIWRISAIPSILFGLFFDEWFGVGHFYWADVLKSWGLNLGLNAPLYIGISRVHSLTTVLGITIVIGLVHLAIGFLIGAINEWHHSKKHAIAKLAWIWVEAAGTIAILSLYFNMLPGGIGIGAIASLVGGIIVLFMTEGIVGILEIPGLAGNVLSYTRIAAIGVVGAVLAEIINHAFTPLPEQGWLALLFFPLFIILHLINAFIAMFESLIQGGRLNIIEFRSKFLKGGGKPFEPFAYYHS